MTRGATVFAIAAVLALVAAGGWWMTRGRDASRELPAEPVAVIEARARLRAVCPTGSERSAAAAEAMAALATSLHRAGRGSADEALDLAEKALWIDSERDGPESDLALGRLNLLAVLLHQRGRFTAARSSFERFADLVGKKSPGSLREVAALLNLAEVERSLEDFVTARRRLTSALAILRRPGMAADQGPLALAWNSLGLALHELGDLEEAREALTRSRDLLVAAADQRPALASVLNNLGRLLHDQRDVEGARAAFEESLRQLDAPGVSQPQFLASTRNNLGYLLHTQGDLAGARAAYEEALRLRRAIHPDGHPDTAWTLSNLGLLAWDEGQLAAAGELFREALALRRRLLGGEHRLTSHSLTYLAALRLCTGDAPEALRIAAEAEAVRLRLVGRVAPLLAERAALRLVALEVFGLEGSSLDLCLAAASRVGTAEAAAVAWEALSNARGLVLDGVAAARRTGEPQREPLRAAAEAAARDLAALWVRGAAAGDADEHAQRLAELRRRAEAAEAELAQAAGAGAGSASRRVEMREIVAVLHGLPASTALVAYAEAARPAAGAGGERRQERVCLAFVLGPGSGPAIIDLGPASEIAREVGAWRRAVLAGNVAGEAAERDALALTWAAGQRLRERIWDPITARLEGATRVLIVPDGPLHQVSFGALPAADGRYLVESGPLLHLLSSERQLLELRAAPQVVPGAGLLALGAPELAAQPLPGFASSLGPIPETGAEAQEVAALQTGSAGAAAGEAVVLLGREATERSFTRQAPGKRLLHLATHGYVLSAGEARFLPGTRAMEPLGERADTQRPGALTPNPLLLAGLVLTPSPGLAAGAPGGDAAGDGVLTALEVSQLDLRGVEWAVLSACRSGEGVIERGEGVFGLRRAFEVAGARSLVVSLWPVGDRATRQWMRHLYVARLLDRQETDAAVREACLQTLAERRAAGESTHPFFWGAFIASGDWQ